jgi:hypothetical protein
MADEPNLFLAKWLEDEDCDPYHCYGCGVTASLQTSDCLCDLHSCSENKLASRYKICHVPFWRWQRARWNVRRILVRKLLLFSIATKVLRREFAERARAQEIASKRYAPGGAGALAAECDFYMLVRGEEGKAPSSKRAKRMEILLDFPP